MVAIKTYEKYKIKQYERYRVGSFDDEKPVCAEIDALSRLDHGSIVHLFQGVYTSKRIHLILEYVPGRTLEDEMRANGGPFSEDVAAPLLRKIMEAVASCHRNMVCHRDLKLGEGEQRVCALSCVQTTSWSFKARRASGV